MAKAFSVASWNVEHFKDDPSRVGKVVDFVKEQKPDIFALYEVEGKQVYSMLVKKMPEYSFHITEGQQIQEILVGVRRTITSFFTQRIEFKSGVSTLRPGALLTVSVDGSDYTLLFLHLKSLNVPVGLGLRDDMLGRAFDFRKTLDKAAGGPGKANFIFMGDLNTMGMKYPYDRAIDAALELKKLDRDAKRAKMRRLGKTLEATWWNGPGTSLPPSNLDHVVASEHLSFKSIGGAEVDVRGWASKTTDAAKGKWIEAYSDHNLLYFVVEKVV